MNAREYLRVLKEEIHSTAIATVDENGLPQVRIIDIMLVEDDKLYFITAKGKEFYKQLKKQKYVAITGITNGDANNSLTKKSISIRGKVKCLGGELLDIIFNENQYMKEIYPKESRSALEVFCLYEGNGEFFDLSRKPIFRERFIIGNDKKTNAEYIILAKCIGCGVCEDVCPQKCIDNGKPYVINQNNCLHCGLCVEKCPVNAISFINK